MIFVFPSRNVQHLRATTWSITNINRWVLLCVLASFFLPATYCSPVIGRQQPVNVLRRFEITQKSCIGTDKSKTGVCMFNFQCAQQNGKVINSCLDGFLFGACCSLSTQALEHIFNENNNIKLPPSNELQILSNDNLTIKEINNKSPFENQQGNISSILLKENVKKFTAVTESSNKNGKTNTSTQAVNKEIKTVGTPSVVNEKKPTSTEATKTAVTPSTDNGRRPSSTEQAEIAVTLSADNKIRPTSTETAEKHKKLSSSTLGPDNVVKSASFNKEMGSTGEMKVENVRNNHRFKPETTTPLFETTADPLQIYSSEKLIDSLTTPEGILKTETPRYETTSKLYNEEYIGGLDDNWVLVASSNSTVEKITNETSSASVGTGVFGNGTRDSDVLSQTLNKPTLSSSIDKPNYGNASVILLTSNAEPLFSDLEESVTPTTENEDLFVTQLSILRPLNSKNKSTTITIPSKISTVENELVHSETRLTTTSIFVSESSTVTPAVNDADKVTHKNVINSDIKDYLATISTWPKLPTSFTKLVIPSKGITPVTDVKNFTTHENSTTATSHTKLTLRPMLVPLSAVNTESSTTTTTTTQEPLLFWTTRAPATRRPQRPPITDAFEVVTETPFEELSNDTKSTLSHLSSSSVDNTYEILLQHIANNFITNIDNDVETSTDTWGSSTYPILTNLTDASENVSSNESTVFIEIPDLNTLGSANITSNLSLGSSAEVMPITTTSTSISSIMELLNSNENNETSSFPTNSDANPPLDINLLVQLLNLTGYNPDDDMFFPNLLDNHDISNEIDGPDHNVRIDTTTPTPTTLSTTISTTTTITPEKTTTMTTTSTTTTSTTTATPTTTRKKWNWKTTCGVRPLVREGRIVNGRRSDFGEWPWQALVRESTWLGIFTKNKCGGVLLNSKYVITAAHCQPGFLASLIVVLGELDVSDDYEPKKTIQKNVKRVVVHKDFIARTFDNDLALLELESPVEFDEHVVPICLPQIDRSFVDSVGYVSGWGRLSYQGSIPNLLHNVEVPVIPNQECQHWFKEAGHTKTIKPEFICAGYKNGKKDSCEGDSGGPLSIREEDGRWVLAGIVSHGIKCAYPNLPGVYMRMTYYKPWIDKIINS